MASDGPSPHSTSLRFGLTAPSHRDDTTPSHCWAPHFMTQERIMCSNPTPGEPHLSPAATMSNDMLSALTPPLHCVSILQPATPPQVVVFRSWLVTMSAPICLNRFTLAESWKPDLWIRVFTFSSSAFAFLIEMNFSFKSLFAVWSLSLQRSNYYFNLGMVSWQCQYYSTILILVLCLLCVTPLVCSSYSSFAPSSPFFSSWWQRDCELFTHTPVLRGSPSTSSRQPQTTLVFADSRIEFLCHMLLICVAHAPTESCPFHLLVHWAFRACYSKESTVDVPIRLFRQIFSARTALFSCPFA